MILAPQQTDEATMTLDGVEVVVRVGDSLPLKSGDRRVTIKSITRTHQPGDTWDFIGQHDCGIDVFDYRGMCWNWKECDVDVVRYAARERAA